jgi:hypothetical protein
MDDLVGRPGRAALGETRQCTATNRNGERCGRASIVGGFVCNLHGGSAPQVKETAQRRLEALVDPALRTLRDAVECGDLALALRASRDILDRAGLPRGVTMTVQSASRDVPPWAAFLTDEELASVAELIAIAKARMASGAPRHDTMSVVDVSSVHDDDICIEEDVPSSASANPFRDWELEREDEREPSD